MGLDKWIKPDKVEKKKSKKPNNIETEKKDSKLKKQPNPPLIKKLSKFRLICSNSKCKYQKIVMKKSLENKDKICPKCKSEMKLK